MQKSIIYTETAPEPIGPYSQAIVIGDFIFTSGQIAINPSTGNIEGTDIKTQTRIAIQNLSEILKRAGSSLDKIIKTTVFIRNMEDFKLMNEVYEEYFGQSKPSRSTVEVSGLPKNALVEIEAIAHL
jgi:2-iminobutanoate/2-iminopropanoate deaminase